MFDRWKLLIGEESLINIKKKKILIVGIGGVGGECAISLIRSGVQDIVIIDYDIVELSNLNRQAVAFHSTIGQKKTEVMFKILKDINPNVNIKIYDLFLDENNIKGILNIENPDFIIDCCDSINTKKVIIKESLERNIKFISSMGTGNRLDPTQLKISEITKTSGCPLAKIIRKWARDEQLKEKIPVLYSTEIPIYRGEVVGTSTFVPNAAGIILANYVINYLIKI